MKNMLNEILDELLDLIPEVSELDDYDIKTKTTPNGFIFLAVKKPAKEDNSELVKFVDEFKEYVHNTDDCIFEQACKKYTDRSDLSLAQLATISEKAQLKDKDTITTHCNLFKDCVKEAVTDFIVELQDKYELTK